MSAVMPGSVHVIILNWRTAAMTLRSLEHAMVAMEGIDGAITVVDNDSGDGSFETLQAESETRGWTAAGRVRVVQSGRNGGFGAGNNVVLFDPLGDGRMPDYVYLLNSDAFPRRDAIRLLRDHLDAHPRVGLAGSRIIGTDGVLHETAFRFPGVASEFETAARSGPVSRLLRRFVVAMPVPTQAGPVDWTAGASLMMRRAMLDRIGGFDETFFLYFEETDLCRRAARAGWSTHYVPQSVVEHLGSASTGMKTWQQVPEYWFASREHYFRKNSGRLGALAVNAAHLAGTGLWRLRCIVTRRDPEIRPGFLRQLTRHALSTRQGTLNR